MTQPTGRLCGKWNANILAAPLARLVQYVQRWPQSTAPVGGTLGIEGGGMPPSDQNKESLLGLAEGGANSGLKSYSPTQLFFLMRLSYLQRQRRECVNVLDTNDWRMRLLNKALYSTFQDCQAAGVGEEAKLLLGQQQPAN